MSNKAKRDEIKRQANALLNDGIAPRDGYSDAVNAAATKIAKRNNRLSIQRAIHREERARRSIARRAQQTGNERLAEALLA